MKLLLCSLLLLLSLAAVAQRPLYEKKLYDLPFLPDYRTFVRSADEHTARIKLNSDEWLVYTSDGQSSRMKRVDDGYRYEILEDSLGNLYYAPEWLAAPLLFVPQKYRTYYSEHVSGRLVTSYNKKFVMLPVFTADSLLLVINHKPVHKVSLANGLVDREQFRSENWCKISNNGNCIYFLKQDDRYHLYVNDRSVASSQSEFKGIQVNSNGAFTYARKAEEKHKEGQPDAWFIHTADTAIGPVSEIDQSAIRDHGGYYYKSGDGNAGYVVVNNQLFRGVYDVFQVVVADRKNFLFIFHKEKADERAGKKKKNLSRLNVNGKVYKFDYEEILFPWIDSSGNFVFFGIRNYYTYPVINGKAQKALSRYGVRATPVAFDPDGTMFYIYETDTHVYVYCNDTLLLPAFPRTHPYDVFTLERNDHIPPLGIAWHPERNWLMFLRVPGCKYFIHDRQAYPAKLPVKPGSALNDQEATAYTDRRYAELYEVDRRNFALAADDVTYEVKNVDEIFKESLTISDRGVHFFARRGKTIIKYSTDED